MKQKGMRLYATTGMISLALACGYVPPAKALGECWEQRLEFDMLCAELAEPLREKLREAMASGGFCNTADASLELTQHITECHNLANTILPPDCTLGDLPAQPDADIVCTNPDPFHPDGKLQIMMAPDVM